MRMRFLAGTAVVLTLAGCGENTESPVAPGPTMEPVVGAGQALVFHQMSAGRFHSCGVTTDGHAYCWGYNYFGALGDGSPQFTSRLTPVPVSGDLRFQSISAGFVHTCGITTGYEAYCWGDNSEGQLGDGTTTLRLTPVRVAGGLRFRQIDAGAFAEHTCGVTYQDNRLYCWGWNAFGQLGDGTTTDRLAPAAVATSRTFRQVTLGQEHTCAIRGDSLAYCWGSNQAGQLGIGNDSSTAPRLLPTRVAGGRRYRQIDAGAYHVCAVAADARAFCWGKGIFGQVGDGKNYLRFAPRAVAGGLTFRRVTGGDDHTCGETLSSRLYCWGLNDSGQLGDGTTTRRLTPVAVRATLQFGQVSAGALHTCAKSTSLVGYCWGNNLAGQLGDGTQTQRLIPTKVAGTL